MSNNVIRTIERANGTGTEAAATGGKYINVAVPNTTGAIGVTLEDYELDIDLPDRIASKDTIVYGALATGKQTYTSNALSQVGMVGSCTSNIACALGASGISPPTFAGASHKENLGIPLARDADGNYYVTVIVRGGSDNTNTKSVNYYLKFNVFR